MILKVARLGHPAVRRPARVVSREEILTPRFQQLLDDMVETMKEYNGVGLAAPQIHLSVCAAVLECEHNPRHPEEPSVPLTFLINPRVEVLDRAVLEDYEGCLSIPELRGMVPRASKVRVTALGRDAEPLEIVASGFHARIIQHETDHLKGEVYLDRMSNLRSLGFLAEVQRFTLSREKGE